MAEWDFEKLASKDGEEAWLRASNNRELDARIKTMRKHVANQLNRLAKRADEGKFPRRNRREPGVSEAPLVLEIDSGVAKITVLHGDSVVRVKGQDSWFYENVADVGKALRSIAKWIGEGNEDEELRRIHDATGVTPMPPRRGRRKKAS